ncbi:MliC family protein [Alteraurantiacibacter palmitatis]|uniref:MliC family protein n=1 Tax=Alteraurantiacibacter palmitatis TaxID=2054628 RepID=A0ABV7E0V8_9SPHN
MTTLKLPVFAAAALLAAGCATTDGPGQVNYFDCGTFILRVTNTGRETIVLRREGRLLAELRLVPAASGARYEGEGYTFHSRGNEATFTGLTREAPHQCRRVDHLR